MKPLNKIHVIHLNFLRSRSTETKCWADTNSSSRKEKFTKLESLTSTNLIEITNRNVLCLLSPVLLLPRAWVENIDKFWVLVALNSSILYIHFWISIWETWVEDALREVHHIYHPVTTNNTTSIYFQHAWNLKQRGGFKIIKSLRRNKWLLHPEFL